MDGSIGCGQGETGCAFNGGDLASLTIGDVRIAQAATVILSRKRGIGIAILGAETGGFNLLGQVWFCGTKLHIRDKTDRRTGLRFECLTLLKHLRFAGVESQSVTACFCKSNGLAHLFPQVMALEGIGHQFDAFDLQAQRPCIHPRCTLSKVPLIQHNRRHPAFSHAQRSGAAHDPTADDGNVICGGLAHSGAGFGMGRSS